MEQPLVYWGTVVGAIAVAAGLIVGVKYLSRPHTLPDRVVAVMNDVDPQASTCLDGGYTQERVRAAERPDLYPDLLPRARSVVLVTCEFDGPGTVVVEFGSRSKLERAFSESRSARRSDWCVTGSGAFDSSLLGAKLFRSACHRMHGIIRPR